MYLEEQGWQKISSNLIISKTNFHSLTTSKGHLPKQAAIEYPNLERNSVTSSSNANLKNPKWNCFSNQLWQGLQDPVLGR